MAWNIPGKNKDNDSPDRNPGPDGSEPRNPWPPRRTGGGGRGGRGGRGGGGNGVDRVLNQLRDMFGGGGGNPPVE